MSLEQFFSELKVTEKEKRKLILHLSAFRTDKLLQKYCNPPKQRKEDDR